MSEAELKSTIVVLRSLANSQKSASVNDLARDYAQTEGGVVPFKKFGYASLEAFLVGSGEFFVTPWKSVQAKCNAESAHINKLVAEQNSKTTKKKTKQFIQPQRKIYAATYQKQPTYQPYVQPYNNRAPPIRPQYQQTYQPYVQPYNRAPPIRPQYQHTYQPYVQPYNSAPPIRPQYQQAIEKPIYAINPLKKARAPMLPEATKDVCVPPGSGTNTTPAYSPNNGKWQLKSDRDYSTPQNGSNPIEVKSRTNQPSFVFTFEKPVHDLTATEHKTNAKAPLKTVVTIKNPLKEKKTIPVTVNKPIIDSVTANKPLVVNKSDDDFKPVSVIKTNEAVSEPRIITVVASSPTTVKTEMSDLSDLRVTINQKVSNRMNDLRELLRRRTATSNDNTAGAIPLKQVPPVQVKSEVVVVPERNPLPDLHPMEQMQSNEEKNKAIVPNVSTSKTQRPSLVSHRLNVGFNVMKSTSNNGSIQSLSLSSHREMIDKVEPNVDIVDLLHEWLLLSPNGMFIQYIPEQFKRAKNITLPDDWFSLIAQHANRFSVENAAGGDDKILYAENAADKLVPALDAFSLNSVVKTEKGTQEDEVVKIEILDKCEEVDHNETTALPSELPQMPQLVMPWSERCWNMNITNAVATDEVWGRLIGSEYSDKLDDLMVDIEMDILQTKYHPTNLVVGHIYLAVSEFTFRVRIERNDFIHCQCLCFSIDHGITEWYPMDQIFVCRPEFLQFPGQAFCLTLFGLEDCAKHPHASSCLDMMLTDHSLIASIVSKQCDYEMQLLAKPDETPRLSAILYDTSSDEDLQLNDVLLGDICSDTQWPIIERQGLTPVTVSYVSQSGEIFCQPESNAADQNYVQMLIEQTMQRHPLVEHRFSKDDSPNRLFLVKDVSDEHWYRATLGKLHGDQQQQAFYVDIGCDRIVDTKNIHDLSAVSQVLQKYPHQAVKCLLFDVNEITNMTVDNLRAYLKPGTSAMIKFMKMSPDDQHSYVNIFMRYQNGPLLNVNYSIQLENEIQKYTSPFPLDEKPDQAEMKIPSSMLLDNPMRFLEKFTTPAIGTMFKVHVTMVCNPYDFMVRSHRHVRSLQDLMVQMQKYVKITPDFVANSDIRVGQAYICQHNDEVWYRVVVHKSFSDSVFLISYCDFGYVDVVTAQRLKVLPPEFRQLPELAIRARLAGVAPRHKEWESDDCLQFQQLTVDKKFVSRIENVRSIGINGDETQLELKLVDVSNQDDVDIAALLLHKNVAIPK